MVEDERKPDCYFYNYSCNCTALYFSGSGEFLPAVSPMCCLEHGHCSVGSAGSLIMMSLLLSMTHKVIAYIGVYETGGQKTCEQEYT
ncbi:MAG: hypothetical protein MPL62_12245, partial [Alphaproteobacteria bacterium]|nr:hypothetical protein [Alphaproteobacteria bacterium]